MTLAEKSGESKDLSADFRSIARTSIDNAVRDYFKTKYGVGVALSPWKGAQTEHPQGGRNVTPVIDYHFRDLEIRSPDPQKLEQIIQDNNKKDSITDRNLVEGLESHIRLRLGMWNWIDPKTPKEGPSL